MRPESCKNVDMMEKCDKLELGATTRNNASKIHDESQLCSGSKLWSRLAQGNVEKMNGSSIEITRQVPTSSMNLGSKTTPHETCYFVRGCVQCKL